MKFQNCVNTTYPGTTNHVEGINQYWIFGFSLLLWVWYMMQLDYAACRNSNL